MLQNYSEDQLVKELQRRIDQRVRPVSQPQQSELRSTKNVLIVTGVYSRPSRNQLDLLSGYTSRKSKRRVLDVIYDSLHKCIRIVTSNTSHGQNFRDDYDWLVGKTTNDRSRVFWTDRDGNTRVRGLLHKAGIAFARVIKG